MRVQKFIELIKKVSDSPQNLGILFLLLALIAWLLTPPSQSNASTEALPGLDQLIPVGMQLVPIAVSNPSALNAVMDDFGVVDLYLGAQRVATGVKILRGQNQSEQFSILVPEAKVADVLSYDAPFRVALRNRSHSGTRFESIKRLRPPTIPVLIESLEGESL